MGLAKSEEFLATRKQSLPSLLADAQGIERLLVQFSRSTDGARPLCLEPHIGHQGKPFVLDDMGKARRLLSLLLAINA